MPRLSTRVKRTDGTPLQETQRSKDTKQRDPPRQAQPEPDGRKLFRWEDGELRPERPPPKPRIMLSRLEWEEVVQYARLHGGCTNCTNGSCKLHGTGVAHNVREEYCKEIGVWDQEYEDKMIELRLYKKGYVKKPDWLEAWEREQAREELEDGDDLSVGETTPIKHAGNGFSLLSIE